MRPRNFPKSLKVTVKENSSAYGYSVSITGAYAVLTSLQPNPTIGNLFAGAAGAVCAFAAVEAGTILLLRDMQGGETEQTRILARIMTAISVGASMAAAGLCGRLLHGHAAWFAGTLSATFLFILFDAFELSIVKGGDRPER